MPIKLRLLSAPAFTGSVLGVALLVGCGDGDDLENTGTENSQITEEQGDVKEVEEEIQDVKKELADADEDIAEKRNDLREEILEKEELEDELGDLQRQKEKEIADVEAEKVDPEPDLKNDPDLGESEKELTGEAAAENPDLTIEAEKVEVEEEPGR